MVQLAPLGTRLSVLLFNHDSNQLENHWIELVEQVPQRLFMVANDNMIDEQNPCLIATGGFVPDNRPQAYMMTGKVGQVEFNFDQIVGAIRATNINVIHEAMVGVIFYTWVPGLSRTLTL